MWGVFGHRYSPLGKQGDVVVIQLARRNGGALLAHKHAHAHLVIFGAFSRFNLAQANLNILSAAFDKADIRAICTSLLCCAEGLFDNILILFRHTP